MSKTPAKASIGLSYSFWRGAVGGLLLLSVLIINPFGFGRDGIWVTPKLTLQFLLLIPLLLLAYLAPRRTSSKGQNYMLAILGATGLYICGVLIATVNAPNVRLSLLGYSVYPEGARYYLLLVGLFLGAALASARDRKLLPVVAGAVVSAGVVTSILAVPQKINWLIDYTFAFGGGGFWGVGQTSGGIYQHQMPTALTWHRGLMGYIALLGFSVAIARYFEQHTSQFVLGSAVLVCAMGVVLSDTRTLLLGLVFVMPATITLALTQYRRRIHEVVPIIGVASCGVLLGLGVSLLGQSRDLSLSGVLSGNNQDFASMTSLSGRNILWQVALDGIEGRPLFGHGYLTFLNHQGDAIVQAALDRGALVPESIESVQVSEYFVVVVRNDGSSWQAPLIGSKPHNAVLEHLHGVGLFGTLALLLLMVFATLAILSDNSTRWVIVPLIAWAVFALFWYESVQFAPLNWVLLGCAFGSTMRSP